MECITIEAARSLESNELNGDQVSYEATAGLDNGDFGTVTIIDQGKVGINPDEGDYMITSTGEKCGLESSDGYTVIEPRSSMYIQADDSRFTTCRFAPEAVRQYKQALNKEETRVVLQDLDNDGQISVGDYISEPGYKFYVDSTDVEGMVNIHTLINPFGASVDPIQISLNVLRDQYANM